jgi:hypothetical protein
LRLIYLYLGLLLLCLPLQAVEFVEFAWSEDGISTPVNIYWDTLKLRVEVPNHQFAVITDTVNEEYLGLELRDARYWQFSWKKLQIALDRSRKNADLLKTPLVADPTPPPPAKFSTYEWKKAGSQKNIDRLHCQLWETKLVDGRRLALWCTTDAEAPSPELWKNYALTQSRLSLVAVRAIGPDLPVEALASLPKEAGVPAELVDGDDEETSSLILKTRRQVPDDPTRFLPPPKYQQDPLSALDGIE